MTSSTIKSRILCMYKQVLKSVKTVFSINSSNVSVSLANYWLISWIIETMKTFPRFMHWQDPQTKKQWNRSNYIYIYNSFSPNSIMMEKSKWNTHGISDARDHNLIDHVNRAWLRNGPTSGNHSALPLVCGESQWRAAGSNIYGLLSVLCFDRSLISGGSYGRIPLFALIYRPIAFNEREIIQHCIIIYV